MFSCRQSRRFMTIAVAVSLRASPLEAFAMNTRMPAGFRIVSSLMSTSSKTEFTTLRVSEIREKLKELGVDYSDCFDKESLVEKLQQQAQKQPEEGATDTSKPPEQPAKPASEVVDVDEIRSMSVKSLREELARRRMRWADYIEKEDLVKAVVKARKEAANFSATGLLTPGQVADLTSDQVETELAQNPQPLLLDVYATWCGPCQLMSKELLAAAGEWNDSIRVVKMDSDKYPELSGKLKVQGLPTIILFRDGSEVSRVEGALQKSQLMSWVEEKLKT